MGLAQAIFAAGCFWGIQAAFDSVDGVTSTEVGYTGGTINNPDYKMVCSGKTGHAEAVEVTFDPEEVSYEELLDVFFKIHNPTTRDRQGPDIGTQYRSAIFYLDEEQKEAAVNKIMELNHSGKYKSPIVTEVSAAKTFYPAEEYHQDYLKKQGQPSCGFSSSQEEEEEEITKTPIEWRKTLTSEQYEVLRNKGTERPFSGKYVEFDQDGTYNCAACGNPIFRSDDKFKSGCGWPSFDKAIKGSVKFSSDYSHGMNRIEVTCARCGSHLGHIFKDGPTPTGDRFCINSVAMDFIPQKY